MLKRISLLFFFLHSFFLFSQSVDFAQHYSSVFQNIANAFVLDSASDSLTFDQLAAGIYTIISKVGDLEEYHVFVVE